MWMRVFVCGKVLIEGLFFDVLAIETRFVLVIQCMV